MYTNYPSFSLLRPTCYLFCLLLGLSSQPLYAACELFRNVKNAPGLALVIGNSRYQNGTLKHPVNDARKMASTLKKMGFEVSFKKNLNDRQMNYYTRLFSNCLKDNQGVGLFYFSGHGTQVVEKIFENHQVYEYKSNYLLPINNSNILDQENVKRKAFPVNTLLNRLKQARNKVNIVILDANRRNPYQGGISGLATDIHYSGHFLIAYPSRGNQTVIDEQWKHNSLYVKHLTRQFEQAMTKNSYIEDMFRAVTRTVTQNSGWQQQPYFQSSIIQDFCFWACKVPLTIRTSRNGEGALVIIDGIEYGYIYNGKKTVKLPIGPHSIQLKTTRGGIFHTVGKKINLTQKKEEYIPVTPSYEQTGSVVIRPKVPTEIQKVSSVAFSPNSRYVLSGGQDRKLWLWDLNTAKLRSFYGHSDIIGSVSFSPDGRYALSGSRDRKVLLWEFNHGQLRRLHTYRGHSGFVSSVSFSSDSRYALSASYDKTIRVWDIGYRRLVRRIKDSGWYSDWILSAVLSPNGDYILSGSRKKIRLWHFSGQRMRTTFSGRAYYFHSVKFFPNGEKLVSGSSDNRVRVWDVKSGKLWRTFWGHSESVLSVDISSDASYIVSGSQDNTVRLWKAHSGQRLHIFKEPSDDVKSVTFSRQGHCILSGGYDGIYLWNTQTKRLIARMMVFTDNEWVIMIPTTGFFAASPRGGQKLSIRFRGTLLGDNASFNNPREVKAQLTTGCQ
jgi:WD40 repeat protein